MNPLDEYIAACIRLRRLRQITPVDEDAEDDLLDEMDGIWDRMSAPDRRAAELWVQEFPE
jgi:hypothetical protein